MNRYFLGLLALAALALMISQAAVAGGGMHSGQNNQQANPEANSAGGVMIIETYTTSSCRFLCQRFRAYYGVVCAWYLYGS